MYFILKKYWNNHLHNNINYIIKVRTCFIFSKVMKSLTLPVVCIMFLLTVSVSASMANLILPFTHSVLVIPEALDSQPNTNHPSPYNSSNLYFICSPRFLTSFLCTLWKIHGPSAIKGPSTLLQIQLPVAKPRKAVEDGPSIWVLTTHRLDWLVVHVSWPQLIPI